MPTFRKLRVFIASPGGLEGEREAIRWVIDYLNNGIANEYLLLLDLQAGDQAMPGMGRPQSVIFENLPVVDWDLFIGVLWHRFGTPTGGRDPETQRDLLSGTEEEFRAAYRRYRETGNPRIMIYRSLCPVRPDQINPGQLKLVQRFFDQLSPKGKKYDLSKTFSTTADFESSFCATSRNS